MGQNSTPVCDQDKIQRFLEDVADAEARGELTEKIEVATIAPKSLLHSDEGLSPASGMAVDSEGRLFVSDEFNHRILVYGQSGNLEKSFGKEGISEGEFRYPRGITFDGDGNLYVADAWNHRIQVFAPDLTYVRSIGRLGAGQGELDEPMDVVWTGSKLVVLEKSNHRIQFFYPDGTACGTVGKRGSVDEQLRFYLIPVTPDVFSVPVFEFPSSIAANSKGQILVADTNNHRVVRLNPNGEPDTSFITEGLHYPTGLAYDADENLHVTQFSNESVSVFSPEGILLYRYKPGGIELPVAISISGGNLYVAGGIKAGISTLELKPAHKYDFSLEGEFAKNFKLAVSHFSDGKWDEALESLSLAAGAEEKPSAAQFAKLLPEDDYTFAPSNGGFTGGGRADAFMSLLNGYNETFWNEIFVEVETCTAKADEMNKAELELETALLGSGQQGDWPMVKNYRSRKEAFQSIAEARLKLAAFKKVQEFQRQLAFCGLGESVRLEQIKTNFEKLRQLKEKRSECYATAERDAPSLNFSSPADERATFALNENRIILLSDLYEAFWNLAGAQNRELASLLRRGNSTDKPIYDEILLEAVDFFAFCPEIYESRFNYFLALEDLFEAFGADKLAQIAQGMRGNALWEPLGREDNIPYAANSEVYRLLIAIWSSGSLECDGEIGAEPWDKILDFYHGEFSKFLGENARLQEELILNDQQLPLAEKGDPKQAALFKRKISLLRFHFSFQERYISNLMTEFLVRFALFTQKNMPIPASMLEKTKTEVNALFDEMAPQRLAMAEESRELGKKIGSAQTIVERNKILVRQQVLKSSLLFNNLLGLHLGSAKKWAGRADAKPSASKVTRFSGPIPSDKLFSGPIGATYGTNGNLFIISHFSSNVVALDAQGRYLKSFAGYGTVESRLQYPLDIVCTPDGNLLVCQYSNRTLSLFTQEGVFIRRFTLEGDSGRMPYRIGFDSAGRLFVSFADGGDMAIHDLNGKNIGVVKKSGSSLEQVKRLVGFCIKDDQIISGGNGKFIVTNFEGEEVKSLVSTDIPVGYITSVATDANGNIYGVDLAFSRLFCLNADLTEVQRVEDMNSQGMVAVAVSGETIATVDYYTSTVLLTGL